MGNLVAGGGGTAYLDWFAHRVPRFYLLFSLICLFINFLHLFFEPELLTALFCADTSFPFHLLFTTETLEDFFYIQLFLNLSS